MHILHFTGRQQNTNCECISDSGSCIQWMLLFAKYSWEWESLASEESRVNMSSFQQHSNIELQKSEMGRGRCVIAWLVTVVHNSKTTAITTATGIVCRWCIRCKSPRSFVVTLSTLNRWQMQRGLAIAFRVRRNWPRCRPCRTSYMRF